MWAKRLIEKNPSACRRSACQQDGAHRFAIMRGKTVYREIPA